MIRIISMISILCGSMGGRNQSGWLHTFHLGPKSHNPRNNAAPGSRVRWTSIVEGINTGFVGII